MKYARLLSPRLLGCFLTIPLMASVTPEGVTLDTSGWIPCPQNSFLRAEGSPLDMSHLLDAPAGKHGFLQVEGEGFRFEDGTPARFWGGNIFGEANFPDKEAAPLIADAIARSGANIVRLHHLDAVRPWTDKVVQRSLFGGQNPPTTRQLDPTNLDRFHYLIHLLKERGIYLFLSHISSRYVMPGDNHPGGAEALDDIGQGFKGEGYFDPFLIQLQKEYLTQLLLAENPYTGLALINEPAMALIEINNENSMFFIRPEKPDDRFAIKSRYYQDMIQALFADWLRAKYHDQAQLEKAWAQSGKAALFPSENLAQGRIIVPHTLVTDTSWPVSDPRKRDTFRFLYDLQISYYGEMYQFLRGLGVQCPIAGSSHWTDFVADLRVNADVNLDFIDRHGYWTNPQNRVFNYSQGQGIQPKPMVKEPRGGNLEALARRRVFGLPYTVSEWHHPLPNPYRAEGPPLMAAYASLQGWHPMHYAYFGEQNLQPVLINSFEGFFDPAHLNLIPISALMFHRGDFVEADRGYFEVIHPDQTLDPEYSPRYNPEVALMGKYGIAFSDVVLPAANDTALLGEALRADGVYRSSTGQMTWDTRRGIVLLDSLKSQGVIGFVGDHSLESRDMRFDLATAFAVVVAASLDQLDLAQSRHILVSTSADARHTDIGISDDFKLIEKTGRFPFLMQPVVGTLSLHTQQAFDVYTLDPAGVRNGKLPTTVKDGVTSIRLSSTALHYEWVARD